MLYLRLCIFLCAVYAVSSVSINSSPGKTEIRAYTHLLKVELYDMEEFNIEVKNFNKSNVSLSFIVQQAGVARVIPSSITLNPGNKTFTLSVEATGAGHSDVHAISSDPNVKVDDIYFIITVYKNRFLDSISSTIGWTYFAAWSLSFYPQVIVNYKRQSVIGLNFDYLALNVLGFTLYSIFNAGLLLIPQIEDEYLKRYPRGLNPVQENDIFMAVHATLITLATGAQCYVYERGDQKISMTAKAIFSIFGIFLLASLTLSAIRALSWLDFLYICSYIKLVITLIKYLPQAIMNYKRKSTVGWSIGTVVLDFIGGMFSILQMVLNAFNYDDWVSIFGDATKMGLGIFSVTYDVIFMIQHYILYNHKRQTYVL